MGFLPFCVCVFLLILIRETEVTLRSQKGIELRVKLRKNKPVVNIKRHHSLLECLLPTTRFKMKFSLPKLNLNVGIISNLK